VDFLSKGSRVIKENCTLRPVVIRGEKGGASLVQSLGRRLVAGAFIAQSKGSCYGDRA
jgi:hypothetical protein